MAPMQCLTCTDPRLHDRPLRARTTSAARPAPAGRAAVEIATAAAGQAAQRAELAGISSARLGQGWRMRCETDDAQHVVIVIDIRHRSAVHWRPRNAAIFPLVIRRSQQAGSPSASTLTKRRHACCLAENTCHYPTRALTITHT